jgi:hypothetical protein
MRRTAAANLSRPYCLLIGFGRRMMALLLGTFGFLALAVFTATARSRELDVLRWPVVVLCGALGGVGLLAVGQAVSRRPLLVLTSHGLTIPARWPRSRTRDRSLRWAQIERIRALSESSASRWGTTHQHYLTIVLTADARFSKRPPTRRERWRSSLVPASPRELRYLVPLSFTPWSKFAEVAAQVHARCARVVVVDDRVPDRPRRLARSTVPAGPPWFRSLRPRPGLLALSLLFNLLGAALGLFGVVGVVLGLTGLLSGGEPGETVGDNVLELLVGLLFVTIGVLVITWLRPRFRDRLSKK